MLDIFTGGLGAMEPLVMGLGGFMMKYAAQSQAIAAENMGLALNALGAKTDAANAADKRGGAGGAWVRRFIVLSVFGYLFGGQAIAAIAKIKTTYLYPTAIKQKLFGLWESGGKMQQIVMEGFVVTPEMWRIGIDIAFFYFGSGVAKNRR